LTCIKAVLAAPRYSSQHRWQTANFRGRAGLYKNILIPTDGSDLAATAVKHGVNFAKEIGAKVIGVTVTEPFHL